MTYSVEGDSKFRINSTTGDLYTKVPIDRETDLDGASKLVVNVVATDGGNSENVCSLLVLINDINDNDPIFTSNNYDFTAPNSLGINKVVAFIEAKDKDIQVNAQVSYSFASDSQFFDLAEYTGEIKVKAALPSEPQVCFYADLLISHFKYLRDNKTTGSVLPNRSSSSLVRIYQID